MVLVNRAESVWAASSTPLLFPCGQRPKGWEDKPNGAKAHSSGKLKFPSPQTDAHSASASQAALMLRAAVKSYCVAVKAVGDYGQ